MSFPLQNFLRILAQREATGSLASIQMAWRLQYYEGDTYFGAQLDSTIFYAATIHGAWLQARQFILDHARDNHDQPIDIYQGTEDGGLYECWRETNPQGTDYEFVSWYMSEEQTNDTLWIEAM